MILQWIDILNDLYGLFGLVGIFIFGGFLLVGFIFYVLSLRWGIKKVNGQDTEFGSAIITAILSYVCSAIPCGCFLSAYIISTRHKVSYGNGILALILAAILPLIIVILFTVVAIMLTIGFPALLAMLGF